ncbi:MAG: hypothetical protein Q8L93_03250 [Rhodocyclaceae bacterium]|nr:hypothetical protein [Rhodocyclaceae bacterium]
MKALFDSEGRCIAIGDGAGFEAALPLPKKATSHFAMRYALEGGKVIDLYSGKTDDEVVAEVDAAQNAALEAAQQAIPAAQATPVKLSRLEFMERLTDDELAAIYAAAKESVQIEVWLDRLKMVSEIDLGDTRTQSGVRALEAAGLLAAGRAGQILGAA